MKIMRSNYDKKHRCPNWSGPALKGSGGDCPGGSLARQMYGTMGEKKHAEWKFFVCYQCGTIVLPNVLKNLDPSWWRYKAGWAIRNWKDPSWREYTLERKFGGIVYRIQDWKYEREMSKFDKLD